MCHTNYLCVFPPTHLPTSLKLLYLYIFSGQVTDDIRPAHDAVQSILERMIHVLGNDQPVRMQVFRELSAAAKTAVGSSDNTVLIEMVENLVGLAAAAQLSATAAAEDPATAGNSCPSSDQTFVVISGKRIWIKCKYHASILKPAVKNRKLI